MLLALALAACASKASQWGDGSGTELISNGSFAQGLQGWAVLSTTVRPASVAVIDDERCRSFGCSGKSPAGTFAAFNGGDAIPNAVLSQTLPTRPGTTYILTFAYGTFDAEGNSLQAIDVVVSSGLRMLQTVPIGPLPGSTDLSSLFKTWGIWFVAVGDSTTITFTDRSPDTRSTDGFLTNVSLKVR
jgi:hypothetical protein